MERFLSNQAVVLIIGTDPNECCTDPVTIIELFNARTQAGIRVVPGDIQTYPEGGVTILFIGMLFVPLLLTVNHLRDFDWDRALSR